MNVKLKKIKILQPKITVKTGIQIAVREKRGINFTDMVGVIIPNIKNHMQMITGTITEVQ